MQTADIEKLTPQERKVADGLARGLTGEEIGQELNLSQGTIRIYIHRAMRQLGMRTRTELALATMRHRMVQEGWTPPKEGNEL